jgi:predicted aspartyl protease
MPVMRFRFAWAVALSLGSAAAVASEPVVPPPILEPDVIAAGNDRALRMTVPVTINGQGPFDFVVDTGADRTVISAELAERLGLPAAGKATLHAMGGSGTVSIVEVATLQVSNNVVRDVRAAALPMRHVGADGLLGIDSLKGQRIVMDFDANTMRIESSKTVEAPVPEDSELIVVTARTRLGQLVMVDADANGQKIWVVVDTGAQNSIANSRLQTLLVRRKSEMKPTSMIDVLGQTTPAHYTIVDQLRIGGMAMEKAAIAFADVHPFKIFGLSKRPSMLLGVDGLRSFSRVSVDFATRKVKFLLPNES